jgi:hypothetical protein
LGKVSAGADGRGRAFRKALQRVFGEVVLGVSPASGAALTAVMVDPGSQNDVSATGSEQSPVSELITVPVSGQGVAAATPAAVAPVEADGTSPVATDAQSSQAPTLIVDPMPQIPMPQTPVPDRAPVGAMHGVLTDGHPTGG